MLVSAQSRCRSIPPGKQRKGPLQLAPNTGDGYGSDVALGVLVKGDKQCAATTGTICSRPRTWDMTYCVHPMASAQARCFSRWRTAIILLGA
eukprot:4521077-Amphidinium_carterae.1